MNGGSAAAANEVWYDEADRGTFSTWELAGQEGLDRLSGGSSFTAALPSAFQALLTRAQLDHVAVDAFMATPHRADRGPGEIRAVPASVLTFMLLAEGSMRAEMGGTAFDVRPGQFVLVDSRDVASHIATSAVRMLITTIDIEHIPPYLRARGMTLTGPLTRTSLVDSYVAFASSLLRGGERSAPNGPHLLQAVTDLQAAVLAEAQETIADLTETEGLRYRMEGYIERHYTEVDLNPASVAAGIGISLRHAHNVFNDEERTLARYIRDRRLDAIALALRSTTDRTGLSELAARNGYGSHEAMSRAFRERFGMAPTEYRETGRSRA